MANLQPSAVPSAPSPEEINDQPIILRKARALALMLETTPVSIAPGELIAGLPLGDAAACAPAAAESGGPPFAPASLPGEGYIADAKRRLAGGCPVLAYAPDLLSVDPALADERYGRLPDYATAAEVAAAARLGLAANSNPGHLQAGHYRVVALGWSGLQAQAADALATLDPAAVEAPARRAFLEAVLIVLSGLGRLADRYAELAKKLSLQTTDATTRARLLSMEAACRAAVTRPPQTLQEAFQLHWLTHVAAMNQGAKQLGRFDQYMYPFYAADLGRGRLDQAGAETLIEALWRKYGQVTAITEDNLQNMILGGQTAEGVDATNELTYLCLGVTARLGQVDPKVSVRLHRGSPPRLLELTAGLIAAGRHQPGVYNDESIIPSLVAAGVPLAHARDYTNDGCSELLVQGRTNPWCFEAKVHLLRCLELVTTRLNDLPTYEAFYQALLDESAAAVSAAIANANALQAAVPAISPNPLVSATVEGCLERMVDLTAGGALYNPATLCVSGVADTTDALVALRTLVYEQEAISRRDLLRALLDGFAGHETLRLRLLNRAPKFGNHDDQVDRTAVDLVRHLSQCVQGQRNPRGGSYRLGLFSYGDYVAQGLLTGATPDGRRPGAGISANFSPAPGRDQEGPFAVLQSTAKVPAALTPGGRAVDITVHSSAFSGPRGPEKAQGLLRAFVASGEMQVQFNVLDGAMLRRAQADPERYRHLTVRIWGFPAHFVALPREFQDHLIARTGH